MVGEGGGGLVGEGWGGLVSEGEAGLVVLWWGRGLWL